jgi:hypothetical protein
LTSSKSRKDFEGEAREGKGRIGKETSGLGRSEAARRTIKMNRFKAARPKKVKKIAKRFKALAGKSLRLVFERLGR